MARTKIEWCDYTINPVKGLCPMACPYCYARRMYKRFHWDETIRFNQLAFMELPAKPCKVFVGSTMELFGDWVNPEHLKTIFTICEQHSEKTFIFLTKQSQNLIKWSPFPENCYVGVSATDGERAWSAANFLWKIEAKVKFLSIEPLLGEPNTASHQYIDWIFKLEPLPISWLIIGQQTPASPKTQPKIEWISEIIEAADKAGIPVFLKDNILELVNYESPETDFAFNKKGEYRQGFPKVP